jgi:hypothetical protein
VYKDCTYIAEAVEHLEKSVNPFLHSREANMCLG